MVIKHIVKSDITKEGTKELFRIIDDLILKKKTLKNPEKLLQKKKEIYVGDDTITLFDDASKTPRQTKTEIGVKDFKVKVPEVSKETMEEFLTSFKSNTIPKHILADFNIDKITKNDDIFKMINGIAKSFKPDDVVKRTRGVKTHKATKASGTRLAKDTDFVLEVLGTKPGKTYNAAEIYGIRQLLEAGAARTRYLAERVTNIGTDNSAEILKFRQHYALMSQIQKVLLGVKTETGRALNQFKIASDASKKYSFLGGNVDDLNRRELLVELGGTDEITKVAELVLRTTDDTQILRANRETGLTAFSIKTSDAIAEVFINVILSNPLTHMRNGLGNWIAQAIVQTERKYAAQFFKNTGSGTNYIAAHSDVARAWGKHMAAKEIMSAMADIYKLSGSKIETRLGKVTSQNFGLKNYKVLGINTHAADMFDLFGKGITLGNIPTKLLKISDDYFKNRTFRAELYELAFNDGMEMWNKGLIKNQDDLATYIASKVAHPSKEFTELAAKQARYESFQTPLKDRQDMFRVGATAQNFKSTMGNVGPFSWFTNYYLPFVRTPTNIAAFVAERTPGLAQVLTRYNAKIAAGGKEAAIAKAQLHLGTMFYLATAPLGYYGVVRGSDIRQGTGTLTGGKSLVQKTTKTQPMQIELPIGDGKYQKISFRSFDPVAQMFANSANFGQMLSLMQGSFMNNVDVNDPENADYAQLSSDMLAYTVAFTFSIGENLSQSTMLAGAGKMVDDSRKIIRGTMAGQSKKALKEVGSEFTSSFVPTLAKEAGKLFNDDSQKLVTEFQEYFKKNIAEGDLWYDYDMRGRKYDKFQYFNQFERDEIDEELFKVMPQVTPVKNYINVGYGNKKLDLSVSVPLNSLEKSYVRKNAGLIFDGYMKKLMADPFYYNEKRKFIKESLINQNWISAKSQAYEKLKKNQVREITNKDGEKIKVNFGIDLTKRATDLAMKEIQNSQRGFVNEE